MQVDLIVLPLHDWKKCQAEGFRTRDAHLLLEFDKHPLVRKILVIDRPITLPEMLAKGRPWKVSSGKIANRERAACLTQVSSKTYVFDMLKFDLIKPLLLQRKWWQYVFEQSSSVQAIKAAARKVGLKHPILWLSSPLAYGVISKLDEELVVFDAIDNWLEHPQAVGIRKNVAAAYQVISKKADLIFTNSKALRDFLSQDNHRTFFVANGVDKDFFNSAQKATPADLAKIPKPIAGYAGKIQQRLDVELIKHLAVNLPRVSFVFIGQMIYSPQFRQISKLANVYYLGDKHYRQLPNYLAGFDVCLIPHIVSRHTESMNPLKIYEYLAAGKPVVSTEIAGVDSFADEIAVASNKEEFLKAVNGY